MRNAIKFISRLLSLAFLILPLLKTEAFPAWAQHVVLSEISCGTAADKKDEFFELYNPTPHPVDISGWKIQYRSAKGKTFRAKAIIPPRTGIAPYGYYLVASTVYSGRVKPDLVNNFGWGISDEDGSIRLTDSSRRVIDLVGWGENSNDYETKPALNLGNSIERRPGFGLGNGLDTDNNMKDFLSNRARNPQNSKSGISRPDKGIRPVSDDIKPAGQEPTETANMNVPDTQPRAPDPEIKKPERNAGSEPIGDSSPPVRKDRIPTAAGTQELLPAASPVKKVPLKHTYLIDPNDPTKKIPAAEKPAPAEIPSGEVKTPPEEPAPPPKSEEDFLCENAADYFSKGRLLTAADLYLKILSMNGNYWPAKAALDGIRENAEKRIAKDDFGISWQDIFYTKSIITYINGNINETLNLWKKILEFDPNNKEVKGYIAFWERKFMEDEKNRLFLLKLKKIKSIFDAAVMKFTNNDLAGARKNFREIMASGKDTEYFEKSEELLKKISDQEKKTALEAEAKKKRDAEEKARAAGIVAPPVPLSRSASKFKKEETLRADPQAAEELYIEGLLNYSQGHLKKALESFEKAARLDPQNEKILKAVFKTKKVLGQQH